LNQKAVFVDYQSIFYPADADLADRGSGWGGGFEVDGGEGHLVRVVIFECVEVSI
jgi:hypothetical protein